MLSLSDEIANTCYYGITSYVSLDVGTTFGWSSILSNVLYNAGFMFTDIVVLLTTSSWEVSNYSYFIGAYVGDFLMRFLYYDPTAI
jgi:hypothetical protein